MSRMRSLICAAAALAALGGATLAVAADGPIEARQKLMKANGAAAKLGSDMAKAATPFDLDKAKGVFDAFADAAAKMPDLFPDTSKTGGDTTASPKIWDDMATFKAGFVKFGKDAVDQKATVKDLDTFKAAFGTVAKDCGSCHDAWRVKKS
jgi:cytochrome c556